VTLDGLVTTAVTGGLQVPVRVIPRSPRTSIDGVRDGRLLIRVTAPPVDRAANDAVVETLARALDLPRAAIRIVSGERSRNKIVEITGLDGNDLGSRFR
jgi:uncharacterized protein